MDDNSGQFAIRLRGLPWSATNGQILEFLDCNVVGGANGIKRTFTTEGRSSGEAYVPLNTQEDVNKCLDKDRGKMGRRYIEVFQSSMKEMDYVLSRSGDGSTEPSGGTGGNDCFVRLRGLPYQCSKEEVAQFFSGLEIMPNGIALPLDDSGRSTGEAFVEFATPKGAEGALEKHKEKIGHRYIEVFKSNRLEANSVYDDYEYDRPMAMRGRPGPYDRPRGPRSLRGGRYGGPPRGGPGGGYGRLGFGGGYGGGDFYDDYEEEGDYGWDDRGGYGNGTVRRGRGRGGGMMKGFGGRGGYGGYGGYNDGGRFDEDDSYDDNGMGGQHIVHMRGLPFKATDDDVVNFFSPIVPTRIHLEYARDGRMTGEGNAEFASHEDAQAAMQKDGDSIMHRYIELFLRGPGAQQKGMRGRRRGGGGYRF